MEQFLKRLKAINPRVKVVLTVSPVPLIATYEPAHVLCATTYSKSVLRVAATMLARGRAWVAYVRKSVVEGTRVAVGGDSGGRGRVKKTNRNNALKGVSVTHDTN